MRGASRQFKPGDRVVIIDGAANKFGGLIDDYKGHQDGVTVYTVDGWETHEWSDMAGWSVSNPDVGNWFVDDDNLRLASPFKVGDTIIMTDESPYGITAAGAIGTIIGLDGESAHVDYRPETLNNPPASFTNDYTVSIKFMRMYTENITMVYSFGDRVEITDNELAAYGTVGLVVAGPDRAGDYTVYYGTGTWDYIAADQMKPATVNTASAPTDTVDTDTVDTDTVDAVAVVKAVNALINVYGGDAVGKAYTFLMEF